MAFGWRVYDLGVMALPVWCPLRAFDFKLDHPSAERCLVRESEFD